LDIEKWLIAQRIKLVALQLHKALALTPQAPGMHQKIEEE